MEESIAHLVMDNEKLHLQCEMQRKQISELREFLTTTADEVSLQIILHFHSVCSKQIN